MRGVITLWSWVNVYSVMLNWRIVATLFYRVDIAYSLCKKMDKGISIRSCKGPGCPFFMSYDESRRDKEFCSKNCKEKWRYHHVVKPKRQGQAI